MSIFLVLCGFVWFSLTITFIFVFFFMSEEDWNELNKYYEEKQASDGNEQARDYNSIYQNNFGSNWPNTF